MEKTNKTNILENLWLNICQKTSWKIASVVIVLLFVGFGFSYFGLEKSRSASTSNLEMDSKRLTFTTSRIQRAMAATAYQGRREEKLEKSVKPKKRNYATDIAVFVFKAKEIRDSKPIQPKAPGKKLSLPAGTKISAYLSGALFSYNVEAPVTAVASKDVRRKGKVIIPKDSQFLGEAGVLKSLNRINVHFDLLIFPDGREKRIRAMALSEDGSAGIKGNVNKHRDMKVLKAIGETLLAGASLFSGVRSAASENAFSLEDQMRLNLSQNLTQQARQDLRDVKVETSITAESYMPIQIILLDGI